MTKTSKITYTAIFAAIATVLMYFEFPIPFMPCGSQTIRLEACILPVETFTPP